MHSVQCARCVLAVQTHHSPMKSSIVTNQDDLDRFSIYKDNDKKADVYQLPQSKFLQSRHHTQL